MKLRKSKHTVCRVGFDDKEGHLHNVTVRLPKKASLTKMNLRRLAGQKAGTKVDIVRTVTCSGSGSVPLAFRRKKK
jgi:hypothetical protein